MRARGVAVPPTRPHASGRPLLWICWPKASFPGAAAPGPPLLSRGCHPRTPATLQGLPPPDPRFFPRGCRPRTPASFTEAAILGPPLLSQRLPPPDLVYFIQARWHVCRPRPSPPMCTHLYQRVPQSARRSWLQWVHPRGQGVLASMGAPGRTRAHRGGGWCGPRSPLIRVRWHVCRRPSPPMCAHARP